jgi:hypothetical protein
LKSWLLSETIYQYTTRLSQRTPWPALVDTKHWQNIYSNYYWLRFLDYRIYYWAKSFLKFCTNRINSTLLAQDRYGYIEINTVCPPTQFRVGSTPILSTWSPFAMVSTLQMQGLTCHRCGSGGYWGLPG